MNEQLPAVQGETTPEPSYHTASRSVSLSDLRDNALSVPVGQMAAALEEYADRRATFYRWLLSQLEQGLHYGVPPGINQPGVEKNRWRHKPSLYKAGADFICDLMGLRDEYEADLASWQMLGSPKDTFVRRCRLYSRTNEKLVGEGTGARRLGQNSKMLEANANIKMADKAAKVAAIINTYGLSDLFAQDLEDLDRRVEAHENPEETPDAPKVQPRNQRQPPPKREAELPATLVPQSQLNAIKKEWSEVFVDEIGTDRSKWPQLFAEWGRKVSGDSGWNPNLPGDWTQGRLDAVNAKLPGGEA